MSVYDMVWHIVCPHCGSGPRRVCLTEDGFERSLPCVARTAAALADSPTDLTPTPKDGLEGSHGVVQDMPVSRDYPDITEPRRTHE